MNNSEDKIIDLAHTLLKGQSNTPHSKAASNDSSQSRVDSQMRSKSDTFPHSTVLDTFLEQAKRSAKMIANNRPANRYECIEIEALIFFTARENKVSEDNLRTQITNDLKIKKLTTITLANYIKIRDYLWAEVKETA